MTPLLGRAGVKTKTHCGWAAQNLSAGKIRDVAQPAIRICEMPLYFHSFSTCISSCFPCQEQVRARVCVSVQLSPKSRMSRDLLCNLLCCPIRMAVSHLTHVSLPPVSSHYSFDITTRQINFLKDLLSPKPFIFTHLARGQS